MKLTAFYNLLVKEITEDKKSDEKHVSYFMENRKDVIELSQKFLDKSNFFASYVTRTLFEMVIALALLAVLIAYGIPVFLEVIILHYYTFSTEIISISLIMTDFYNMMI